VIESPPHPTNARKANACNRNPRILSARAHPKHARECLVNSSKSARPAKHSRIQRGK